MCPPIIIDLKNPKLNWDNENVPVKQNFNAVLFMFMLWLVGGLFVLIGYYAPFNGYILSILIGAICLFGCYLFYSYIKKKDIDLYTKF